MPDKPIIWLGNSLKDVRDFPAVARRLAGFQLRRIQQGLDPDDWEADEDPRPWGEGDPDSRRGRPPCVLRDDARLG